MEYFLTFLEGIASFISPCLLPMLPIYISYFSGSDSEKNKALKNSIAFVLGFSLIFIILAILSNLMGIFLTQYLKYIKYVFGVLIIFLGLNYMEIFKFKLFSKFKKFNSDVKDMGIIKAFIFGIMFSISMTPCVGTFLSSALLLIANQESLLKGIILILLYCLGLGIPFIISSLLIDKLKNVFNVIKKNFKKVKIISGIILIIMGVYLIFF
jgi:cytochrome c-type biogenesis protein